MYINMYIHIYIYLCIYVYTCIYVFMYSSIYMHAAETGAFGVPHVILPRVCVCLCVRETHRENVCVALAS